MPTLQLCECVWGGERTPCFPALSAGCSACRQCHPALSGTLAGESFRSSGDYRGRHSKEDYRVCEGLQG